MHTIMELAVMEMLRIQKTLNITEKSIILADPGFGRYRRMGLKNFDHLWFDFAKDYERSPEDLELRTILLITKP